MPKTSEREQLLLGAISACALDEEEENSSSLDEFNMEHVFDTDMDNQLLLLSPSAIAVNVLIDDDSPRLQQGPFDCIDTPDPARAQVEVNSCASASSWAEIARYDSHLSKLDLFAALSNSGRDQADHQHFGS
ncbi:unnamed protein product [Phytophthora fragariaefolia]|uniref:Unnamed protein product n=1 Tax=Phytophthora fragariaefolia TaxID=1490495 RepID=A0A9W6YH22_9STRA|nr:unnamed protein product [Phytophthora fragariaefolia]